MVAANINTHRHRPRNASLFFSSCFFLVYAVNFNTIRLHFASVLRRLGRSLSRALYNVIKRHDKTWITSCTSFWRSPIEMRSFANKSVIFVGSGSERARSFMWLPRVSYSTVLALQETFISFATFLTMKNEIAPFPNSTLYNAYK